ncbi:uncharacterized protein LOC111619575 [Centruroides sculpturatus]|uniref:uncharacterized protein LOC111619575 n=1 Tax=Centruroides sculpturatus TaxID=218467 RepID=UPI000C6CAE96|nr:uncharacterized protein LOC111619575 [Centruroides sculpturatus]
MKTYESRKKLILNLSKEPEKRTFNLNVSLENFIDEQNIQRKPGTKRKREQLNGNEETLGTPKCPLTLGKQNEVNRNLLREFVFIDEASNRASLASTPKQSSSILEKTAIWNQMGECIWPSPIESASAEIVSTKYTSHDHQRVALREINDLNKHEQSEKSKICTSSLDDHQNGYKVPRIFRESKMEEAPNFRNTSTTTPCNKIDTDIIKQEQETTDSIVKVVNLDPKQDDKEQRSSMSHNRVNKIVTSEQRDESIDYKQGEDTGKQRSGYSYLTRSKSLLYQNKNSDIKSISKNRNSYNFSTNFRVKRQNPKRLQNTQDRKLRRDSHILTESLKRTKFWSGKNLNKKLSDLTNLEIVLSVLDNTVQEISKGETDKSVDEALQLVRTQLWQSMTEMNEKVINLTEKKRQVSKLARIVKELATNLDQIVEQKTKLKKDLFKMSEKINKLQSTNEFKWANNSKDEDS